MRFERHQSAVVLASVVTVLAFLGTTVYTQYRLSTLDKVSSTIAANAVPGLEYLGLGGVRLQTLRQTLSNAVRDRSDQSDRAAAREELKALHEDIDRYLRLTPLHGENQLWLSMGRDFARIDEAARTVLQALDEGDDAAPRLLRTQFEPALDEASETMRAALEFDVQESERLAREVGDVRRATRNSIIVLDAAATGVAALLALLALRAARDHDRLQRAHAALLSDRVAELDRFAGRVAHDILSPLDTVSVGLALLAPSADGRARVYLERCGRALQRVQQLVDGLLRFARSGAPVEAGEHAAVEAVLQNVATDYSESAGAAGVDIVVEPSEGIRVACSPAVLTSIVQNLVSNSIKYIGDSPTRRIRLSTRGIDRRARIEVADTGPGIPPEVRAHMFDPFVRGPHTHVNGIGLGLATVKRLVEAHGGEVHVESAPGTGTVVKVDLPLTTAPAEGAGAHEA